MIEMQARQLRERKVSSRAAPVALSASACLVIRRPGFACANCADACPAGAIAIGAQAMELDGSACLGCGRCAAACPTGALTATGFAARPDVGAMLECQRVAAPDRADAAQVVPCLGGVGPDFLRAALAENDVTIVDRGWCADCPAGGNAAPWQGNVDRIAAELVALGAATRIVIESTPLEPDQALPAPSAHLAESERMSRRQFFTRVTTPRPADRAAPIDPLGGLSGRVDVSSLERRLSDLRTLSRHGPLPAALFPELQIGSGDFDDRTCASLCPTGALTLVEMETESALRFDAALCLDCGVCTEVATADALHLSPSGTGLYRGPVTLREWRVATCARCRMRYRPQAGQNLCGGCSTDNELAAFAHGLTRRRLAMHST